MWNVGRLPVKWVAAMNSSEGSKKTCKDYFFGSQQHNWLASVLKHILFYIICWEKKLRPYCKSFSKFNTEVKRSYYWGWLFIFMIKAWQYLATIYVGSAMDWFYKMISKSWNTANTFQLPQLHRFWDFIQTDKLAPKFWAAGGSSDMVSSE